jgi:predicted amidohydrolase
VLPELSAVGSSEKVIETLRAEHISLSHAARAALSRSRRSEKEQAKDGTAEDAVDAAAKKGESGDGDSDSGDGSGDDDSGDGNGDGESDSGGADAVAEFDDSLLEPAAGGPSFRVFSALAKEVNAFIVFGFPQRCDADADAEFGPTITQGVVGPEAQLVCAYSRVHLDGSLPESQVFQAGGNLAVFSLGPVRFGLLAGHDLWFPDVWRRLAEAGVTCVLHAGSAQDENHGKHESSWHSAVRTRAVENGISVVSVNRAGKQFGSSLVARPDSSSVEPKHATKEHVFSDLVDLDAILDARSKRTFAKDRANYGSLKLVESIGSSGADDSETRRARRRVAALAEIFTSEQAYVQSLQSCIDLYYKPLNLRACDDDEAPGDTQLTRTELLVIFGDLEILLLLNGQFMHELEGSRVSEVFLRMAPLLQLYRRYVARYEAAMNLLTSSVFYRFLTPPPLLSLSRELPSAFLVACRCQLANTSFS